MYSNLHKCWKLTHVIIGPPNAGKTLFFEYCTNAPLEEEKSEIKKKTIATQTSKFSNGYYRNSQRPQTTIGMDLGVRHIKVDKQPVTLNIWDTAGQDKYETITNQYFRKADIIWIVIDLTDEDGIDSLKRYWIPRAFEYATKPHVQAILIGNKYDIIQEVLSDQDNEYEELKQTYHQCIEPKVQRLISKYKLPYFQMSAKTGYNVVETFMKVTTAFMRSITQKQTENDPRTKSTSSLKSKSRSKRRKNKRSYRSYNREVSMSRDDSITLDSRELNFADDQPKPTTKSGCCY